MQHAHYMQEISTRDTTFSCPEELQSSTQTSQQLWVTCDLVQPPLMNKFIAKVEVQETQVNPFLTIIIIIVSSMSQ